MDSREHLSTSGHSTLESDKPVKLWKLKDRLRNGEDLAYLPNDKLVIADRIIGAVRVVNKNGDICKPLVTGIKPMGITTNRNEHVIFADRKSNNESYVKLYSADRDRIGCWGGDITWKPHGIDMNRKGYLVISDTHRVRHSISIFTQDGRRLHKFGSKGSEKKEFNNPLYVQVDSFNRIMVSDKGNHCVKFFDEQGKFLGKFGSKGNGPGCLNSPRGLCCDARGNIIVCDTGNNRVSLFSNDGRFLQHLLESGDGVRNPYGVAYSGLSTSNTIAVTQHTGANSGHLRKLRVYELSNT